VRSFVIEHRDFDQSPTDPEIDDFIVKLESDEFLERIEMITAKIFGERKVDRARKQALKQCVLHFNRMSDAQKRDNMPMAEREIEILLTQIYCRVPCYLQHAFCPASR